MNSYIIPYRRYEVFNGGEKMHNEDIADERFPNENPDIYRASYVEELMDNDAISSLEAGFLEGYNQALNINTP